MESSIDDFSNMVVFPICPLGLSVLYEFRNICYWYGGHLIDLVAQNRALMLLCVLRRKKSRMTGLTINILV